MNTEEILGRVQSNNYLMLGAVGIGVYLIYKAIKGIEKVGEGASDVVDAVVSKPVADFITWIVLNKPNVTSGHVIFQSGTVRPITDLKFVRDAKPGENFFIMSLNGQNYRLYARTPNGYYPAVLDQ